MGLMYAVFFYVFAALILGSGVAVVFARHPVHAMLSLVLAFCSAACLFLLIGAEFLAMILIVVYVGAVAVLFLFIVMMLDVDVAQLRSYGLRAAVPAALSIVAAILLQLGIVFSDWKLSSYASGFARVPIRDDASNIRAIGEVLYTDYGYHFQSAGLVLLVAMVGSIVLALHHRSGVRRQNIAEQVGRRREDSVEIRKVKPGQGV